MVIDLIEKTPDALLGTLLAGAVWFGGNYAVLAPRAMALETQKDVLPTCMVALEQAENAAPINRIPNFKLPSSPDDPLDDILGTVLDLATSGYRLSAAERHARCMCGTRSAQSSSKFDYAVHTSSFRYITPESVSGFRSKSLKIVQSQACGALPWLNVR